MEVLTQAPRATTVHAIRFVYFVASFCAFFFFFLCVCFPVCFVCIKEFLRIGTGKTGFPFELLGNLKHRRREPRTANKIGVQCFLF